MELIDWHRCGPLESSGITHPHPQAKSLLFTDRARKISPALDTHKHREPNRWSWLSALINDLTAVCVLKSTELEWDLLMLALKAQK